MSDSSPASSYGPSDDEGHVSDEETVSRHSSDFWSDSDRGQKTLGGDTAVL